jgi:hypothetical protein
MSVGGVGPVVLWASKKEVVAPLPFPKLALGSPSVDLRLGFLIPAIWILPKRSTTLWSPPKDPNPRMMITQVRKLLVFAIHAQGDQFLTNTTYYRGCGPLVQVRTVSFFWIGPDL